MTASSSPSLTPLPHRLWAALWPALAAVAAGLGQTWALAWPWAAIWKPGTALWGLQLGATVVIFALLVHSRGRWQAALLAWLFAWSWLAATVAWLYVSLHVYGGIPALGAVAAVAALTGFLALYFAWAGWLYKHWALRGQLPLWAQCALLPTVWLVAELMRHSWFTGFPWGASAYAQVDGPLAFLAPVVGAYGIAFVVNALAMGVLCFLRWAWLTQAPYGWGKPQAWRTAVLAWLAVVLLLAQAPQWYTRWGPPRTAARAPIAVDLLQGQIAQGEKFDMDTGVQEALAWYGEALAQSQAQLVVTPETAIPLLPYELPDGYWLALQRQYTQPGRAALVGMPLGDQTAGYRNAVVGLQPSSSPTHYAYYKQHLVPFGEFIPPMFRWFTDLMHIPLGDFARGERVQASFAWAGERFAPNICYEDLFGDELAARFTQPELAPTVLVNMSNLGWFGQGTVLDQHLHMARMRSMELDRPSLRATNTGMTALIDRHGQVQAQLPRGQQAILRVQVQGNDGLTPYARWAGRWGHWPLWGISLGLLFCFRMGTQICAKKSRKKD